MPRASQSFAHRGAEEIERLARLNGVVNTGLAFRRTVSGCIGLRGQHVQTWHHIERIATLPPMAVFWGDGDAVIPVSHAYDVGRRLANVTVNVYPRSGHFVHLENAELLAADLSLFLVEADRAPARLRNVSLQQDHARAA
jgi:pimeloyl-ACP methyl ester carboxylesterase